MVLPSGIVSPSFGGGAIFPHRVERGIAYLEGRGSRVKLAPHAMTSIGYVSDTPENRAADLHAMFLDPEVRAIFTTLGGDMLVGRPYGDSAEECATLRSIIVGRTRRYDFPIITDMDFEHTVPQFVLLLGCHARIDSAAQRFEIVEAALR